MTYQDNLPSLLDFLRTLTADPQLPDDYRNRAAALVLDLNDPQKNPLRPPIDLSIVNGKVIGHANFGNSFEGYSGTVHGRFVAAAFDQVLYMAESISGLPAMTATLTVHYRNATPLNTKLTYHGEIDRIEGRKVYTRATVSANGVVTAESEGLFIAPNQIAHPDSGA